MRTTLDIDDDVLAAARELADQRRSTAGKVLSELARKGLAQPARADVRNGVPLLPRRAADRPRPTLTLVNRLRDEP